jgi:putative DNA primase/helicase
MAMADAGIVTDDTIIADGVLRRIHVEGHRRGTRNAAYILHGDNHPAGWILDFKTGVSGTWRADGGRWRMDDETQRRIAADREKRQAEMDDRHMAAARRATALWDGAILCDSHPYLTRKHVRSHGLRTIGSAIVVPLWDEFGVIWSLQFIAPDGAKRFLAGGRKRGLFFTIGGPTDTILIAEGYATGATLFETTGMQTIVAFDAGNLKPVAMTIRRLHPDAKIVICGDNDRFTPGNPGMTKAREAALAVGGLVSIPEFQEGADGTD